MATRKLYFAYGSNLSEGQMRRRCPGAKLIGAAILKGYRIAFTFYSRRWGGGCADIVRDPTSEVWGLIYSLTGKDLLGLDICEGNPDAYRRIEVEVAPRGGGRGEKALTYEVVSKGEFPPTEEYLGIMTTAAEKHGFPDAYREILRSVRTAPEGGRAE
jgi:gamma-glutamylcyclotransferase (GGCT)/AIG2-like uncharacterized protein YtfP